MLIIFTTIIIFSCKKEDNISDECLLVTLKYPHTQNDFFYDERNRINRVEYSSSNGDSIWLPNYTTWSYFGNTSKIREWARFDGSDKKASFTRFFYDENDVLIKRERYSPHFFFDDQFKLSEFSTFEYDETADCKNISEYNYNYDAIDNESELWRYRIYEYTDANCSHKWMSYASDGTLQTTQELIFDDQKSPQIEPFLTPNTTLHNLIEQTYFSNWNDTLISSSTSIYEFNEAGFPTKKIQNRFPGVDRIIEYEYSCN